MKNKRDFLIYDAYCDFCYGLAGFLHTHLNVHTVPSYMVRLKAEGLERNVINRDVHFVVFNKNIPKVYHGAEAAVRVIGIRFPFVIYLYYIPVIRQLIQAFYFIVKKLRKHLGNLF